MCVQEACADWEGRDALQLLIIVCLICHYVTCEFLFIARSKQLQQINKHMMATHSTTLANKNIKMTGLSKQYLLIKNKYPDFIVLFQVGDFYEIYSEDAVKVAEKTSLRISRNPNVNKLMAGFPVRSLDSWLTTLVQQGFQLAICPQQPEK